MSSAETEQPQGPDVEDIPRSELKDYPQDGRIWIWYKDGPLSDDMKKKQWVRGWIPYMAATCVFPTLPQWALTANAIVRGIAGVTHLVDPDRGVLHESRLFKVDITCHLKRWKSILSNLDDVGLVEDTRMLILDYDEESWMYFIAAATTPPGYYYLHAVYNSVKECAGGIKLLAQNPLLHTAARAFGRITESAQSKCTLDTFGHPPLTLVIDATASSCLTDDNSDEINEARKLWLRA